MTTALDADSSSGQLTDNPEGDGSLRMGVRAGIEIRTGTGIGTGRPITTTSISEDVVLYQQDGPKTKLVLIV